VQDLSIYWFSALAMAERLLSKIHAIALVLVDTDACEDHCIYDDE